jgi:hypothetical protein
MMSEYLCNCGRTHGNTQDQLLCNHFPAWRNLEAEIKRLRELIIANKYLDDGIEAAKAKNWRLMMGKNYPRLGRTQALKYPQGICVNCGGNESELKLHIQYNYMRGDDDVITCHKQCKESALKALEVKP